MLLFPVIGPLFAQSAAERLMEVERILVTGTRLPSDSVIRLSGIKVHDKVNDLVVNKACHNITATGLVKSVDYTYDAYPDRPEITLTLTIKDEGPLLPASIKPQTEEELFWSALQRIDPIFTRDLPPTEKGLAFYTKNLDTCLNSMGRSNEYFASDVTADSSGKLTGIVFEIRKYKASPAR
jgi:hypothetical protein